MEVAGSLREGWDLDGAEVTPFGGLVSNRERRHYRGHIGTSNESGYR